MVGRVEFPMFEIVSGPKMPFKELRTRMFEVEYKHSPITEEQLEELREQAEETRIANKPW